MLRNVSKSEFLNSVNHSIRSNTGKLIYYNCIFKDFYIIENSIIQVDFNDCEFENIIIKKSFLSNLSFSGCHFKNISIVEDCELRHFFLANCFANSVVIKDSYINDFKANEGKYFTCYITNNLKRAFNIEGKFSIGFDRKTKPDPILVLQNTNIPLELLESDNSDIEIYVNSKAISIIKLLLEL